MKRYFLLTAALASAVFLLFSACDTDSGETSSFGVNAPSAGDLPEITSGGTYVADETAATALLAALRESGVSNTVRSGINGLVESKADDNGSWSFKDDTSVDGLKVSSSGSYSYKSSVPDSDDDYVYKVGDYREISQKSDTTAEITKDKSSSGITVLTGGKIAEKTDSSGKQTVKSLKSDGSPDTFTITGSEQSAYGYGFTVLNGGVGGKVVFSATYKASFSGVMQQDEPAPKPTITASGSLKVYGAENALIYTKNIASEKDFEEVIELLGISNDD
jgi:hypothetical protein